MALPINQINQLSRSAASGTHTSGKVYSQNELAFEKLLKEQLSQRNNTELQFSKHAAARVEQRGIDVNDGLMTDLQNAVEKARSKGAKDVVVIGQNGAFIVNVPNNIVVTTMSKQEMKDNIFTNIDSAVIM